MAKAVMSDSFGPPESYELRDINVGPPKATQIQIEVKAAGISFVDVLTARGEYQAKPPLPFIPGSECAGIIKAIGPKVTGFAIGDKVVATAWGGIFADIINLPSENVHLMPSGMRFEEAAVLPVSYSTAWHALVDRAQIKMGETLLVLGAGGATGYAAIQIGKHLGAHVIGSASSKEKRALALAGGADAVVDARSESWRDDVKSANNGNGVNIIFDPVGGDATDPAFRSLAWNGRHLVVGFPGGIAALPTNLPLLKGSSLIGVNVRQFGIFEPEKSAANRKDVFALAAQGILKPAIAASYPQKEFAAAMNAAANGKAIGRIIVTMNIN